MNNVIQYVGEHTFVAANTGEASDIPLKVSDGWALRLHYIEFRLQFSIIAGDIDMYVGVSRKQNDEARVALAGVVGYAQYMAFWSHGQELTTSGASFGELSHRIDLWREDYRLVLSPTFHGIGIGNTGPVNTVVAGELVRVSQGQRNAIIAWQGGAKD